MDCRVVLVAAYFVIVILFNRAIAYENNTKIVLENAVICNRFDIENCQNTEEVFSQRKWITQLFKEAQMKFRMDSDVDIKCKMDFDLYKLHLRNQSLWAVKILSRVNATFPLISITTGQQIYLVYEKIRNKLTYIFVGKYRSNVMDSSEWPTNGIISGTVDFMGNYDECLSISSYDIDGKYCLAEAMYDYSYASQSTQSVLEFDTRISAWDALMMYRKNRARVNRQYLKFAVCVPSSCTAMDLKISLNSTLYPIFNADGINLTVDVNSIFCNTRKTNFEYPRGYYVVSSFFIVFFLFVICSSICDTVTSVELDAENNGKSNGNFVKSICKIFSIGRNFEKLKNTDSKDNPATHLAKIVFILFIIYGHRIFYTFGFPTSNAIATERYYKGLKFEFIHVNGVVDVFIFISGFLTFHFDRVPMSKGGKFFLFSNIILRWIRMVPVFMMLTLFIIYILPYVGEGPLWNDRMINESNKCQQSFWASLLAINNIFKTDQQCLIVSWYISVDLQLAIIGSILLYIFTKHETIGICLAVLSFISSIAITFIVAYGNHFYGLVRFYFDNLKDLRTDEEFIWFYDATYARCGPYLMGFLIAYVIKLLNEKHFKFTNKQIYLFLFICVLITEISPLYGSLLYEFNRTYDRLENSLYAALSRIVSIFFYTVLTCIYYTSGLGKLTEFVEWKIWIPFGRLTYSVFLINTVIQLYHTSSQKEPISLSGRSDLMWWFFGDVIWSYMLGLILHLFLEAPILNIRILIKKQLSKTFENTRQDECIKVVDTGMKDDKITSKPPELKFTQFDYIDDKYTLTDK